MALEAIDCYHHQWSEWGSAKEHGGIRPTMSDAEWLFVSDLEREGDGTCGDSKN